VEDAVRVEPAVTALLGMLAEERVENFHCIR
jgi:hypothetical protein